MFDWSKVWRILIIAGIILAAVAIFTTYFHENSWWTGFVSVGFFLGGAIAGYLGKGLADRFIKKK